MTKSKKIFAIHPGEILKTEFMEPMGMSAYALAKALSFPGIYEVVRGDRAITADTAVRLGKYFGLPAQFWLNLQNDYDLRIAERSGIGRGIKTAQRGVPGRTCRCALGCAACTDLPARCAEGSSARAAGGLDLIEVKDPTSRKEREKWGTRPS